ncbi:hypothetical protein [Nostoc sp.]|uniref:hypothetical protein n=1 Tax=Nostoc sp. TaxID=1180 RepID=UPI002FF63318
MSKIKPEVANRHIESFKKCFGKAHLYLAYHAAFPLALTPDLLYRLWANFQRDIHGQVLNIPWIAVGDLLLSSLCDEVGYELYEMDVVVRNILLKRLQEDEKFGQQRINQVSDFLLDYVKQQLESDDPDIKDFAQVQHWTALAYTQPSKAARELALAFSKLNQMDKPELIRMGSLIETFIEPLAEFQDLVIYARGMQKFACGNLEAAKAELGKVLEGGKQIQVAGVSLPIPKQIKADFQSRNKYYPKILLVLLGLLGVLGFIVWRILNPEPLRLENFSANNTRITEEEDEVALKWDIHNYQQLQKLVLTTKGSQPIQPITYDFRNGIPETLGKGSANEIPPCQVQEKQELICSNVKTGVKTKGNYTFELQAFYRNGIQLFSPNNQVASQTTQVEIAENQIAEVINFQADKPLYTKGQNILLSWTIGRPLLLAQIQITGSADDGTSYGQQIAYKFNQGKIADPEVQKLCTQQNQQLQCTNISLPATKAGNFTFQIKAFSNNGSQKDSLKKTDSKIEILPKPFKIVSFQINGSEQPNLVLKEGESATLSWRVEGENIQVKLLPYGNDVKPVDSIKLPVNQALPPQIALQVNDVSGKQQPQQRGFAITVIKKVVPTPVL